MVNKKVAERRKPEEATAFADDSEFQPAFSGDAFDWRDYRGEDRIQ